MRRLLAPSLPCLLAVILAMAAGQAGAQSTSGAIGLRGSQSTDSTQNEKAQSDKAPPRQIGSRAPIVAPEPVIAAPPPPPLMSMLPQPEAPLCRTTCARSYYFCLSGGDAAEDCSGSWAQCVSTCNRPST